jgi:hypothetical protein
MPGWYRDRSLGSGGSQRASLALSLTLPHKRRSKQTPRVAPLGLKGKPTADERLPPSHLRRDRRAFGQRPQLRPHDAAVDAAGKRALRETAISGGHQVVATDALRKAHEPLGYEFRMFDDVGCRSGPAWVHEIKHDGYRMIARRDNERVRLYTRRGLNWTDCYPRRRPDRGRAPFPGCCVMN